MNWTTAADLELYAYLFTSNDEFLHGYFAEIESPCGNIFYDQKFGSRRNTGCNEENLCVEDVTKFKKIIIVANIFGYSVNLSSSEDKFNNYDSQIVIKTLGEEMKMFLNSEELGRWAVIGMIYNQNGVSDFNIINTVLKSEPTLNYVRNLS